MYDIQTDSGGISWGQQERIKYIELQLLWARKLNARLIMETFNISRYQAGLDIKRYIELCPDNVLPYSANDKCYKASTIFVPKFVTENALDFISVNELNQISCNRVQVIPTLNRKILDGVVSAILAAIDAKCGFEAIYASATTPQGKKRTLYPSTIIFTGHRLHIRAFCVEAKEYRDFVLSRFKTIPSIVSQQVALPIDTNWEEMICLILVPNPHLNGEAQRFISEEYDLDNNGSLLIRKALIPYFIYHNNIPSPEVLLTANPWSHQVVVKNFDELIPFLF
jgi:hypothetical protein